jgi:hypothetical protein
MSTMEVGVMCPHRSWTTAAIVLLPAAVSNAEQSYTEVTAQYGISVSGLGSGAGWSDLDGDGDLDLLVSTSSGTSTWLYRNDGSTFTEVSSASGLSEEARNFAFGDYDDDGLDDVAFISFGYVEAKLYHNVGGLVFDDVSDTAPVSGTYSWRCAWVDYDDDGLLDLYLCGTTSYLFHNLNGFLFEECAASAGIQTGGRSCAWLDYDNDGDEDCYVGRSGSPNLLYSNDGDGTFTEVGTAAGVADPGGTSGVCAGDYDADGFMDLYSVNINSPNNVLYHNEGDGTFTDVTTAAGVGDVGDGRTATFLDIDYDGLVDLFSSNHVNPNRLYRNVGLMPFVDIAPALGIDDPPDPFGTAFGDFDGDGDLDVFLATHFGNELLRCDGVTNHFLIVRLVGTASNRDAIGAVAGCSSGSASSWMRVDGGHGMGDYDSTDLEFGLGQSSDPATVEVRWPSGLVEFFTGLPPDTLVVLTEGTGTGIGQGSPEVGGIEISGISPNPCTGSCSLELAPGCGTGEVLVQVFDPAGRLLLEQATEAGQTRLDVCLDDVCSGAYIVRATTAEGSDSARLVLLR